MSTDANRALLTFVITRVHSSHRDDQSQYEPGNGSVYAAHRRVLYQEGYAK